MDDEELIAAAIASGLPVAVPWSHQIDTDDDDLSGAAVHYKDQPEALAEVKELQQRQADARSQLLRRLRAFERLILESHQENLEDAVAATIAWKQHLASGEQAIPFEEILAELTESTPLC